MASVSESTVEELRKLNAEMAEASKLLIRKDLELTRANERLQALDKTKSEFISVASHQLRTPLSAIKWVINMLLEGDLGALQPEQESILRKGYESNERMIRLINDMLVVSRIEAGKFAHEPIPLYLEDILDNVLLGIEGLRRKKNIMVKWSMPKEKFGKVMVDPSRMHSVFENLLTNAIKYTPSGGVVSITLTRPKEREALVMVSDSGMGIPKDEQKNIFTRFYRSKNAIRSETDGSGLGLYIVKQIIAKHYGKIWFESAEDKGTTFFVSLDIIP